jgi:DNA-directed RNA polymerase subunit alpha
VFLCRTACRAWIETLENRGALMARKNLLKGFARPTKLLKLETGETDASYGQFSAAPFEPGFGVTVGNTLRRVLLSSIEGYAISGIKVTSYNKEGVAHQISSEFEQIADVKEDTLEIINNLKQVRLKLSGDAEDAVALYEWTGPAEVKSEDLAKEGQIEIVNQGLHLFSLMEGGRVEMEVQYNLGRGYVPSETNAQYLDVVNTIPIDSIFSPVKRVKYAIEPTRVGQRSDYDKLVLEIWTDGTVKPEDALAEAAKITKEYFQIFINFDETMVTTSSDVKLSDERMKQILTTPVNELDLTVRSRNGLDSAKIETLGDLVKRREDDLMQIPNFGKRSLQEIKEKLQEWGLALSSDKEGENEKEPVGEGETPVKDEENES